MPKIKKPKSAQEINKFWNFVAAKDNKPAELILYGDISTYSWFDDDITPQSFSDDLNALGNVDEIIVRINSGGGDVFAANAIYARLKDHAAKITVKIDGWAASAATIIAMAGDKILIPANGVFMIHNPKMGAYGYYDAAQFSKLSEELEVIKNSIITGYALKTGKDQSEISALMDKETWYDGQQAVDNGFCDEIMFGNVETEVEDATHIVVNSVSIDTGEYPNIPTSLFNRHNNRGGDFTNINNKKGVESMANNAEIRNVEELRAAYPALVAQVATDAAAEERTRIKDIESVAIPGFEDIINKAKFEKPESAANVAMAIISKQKEQGKNYLADVDADVKDSNADKVQSSGSEGGKVPEDDDPFGKAIDRMFSDAK